MEWARWNVVMHEHFSLSVLQSGSKRRASIDIHSTASMRCDSIFVNLWVYMVIPEQPQTSTAVSAWGRGALFPLHKHCKIKNHSLRSHNFRLKHNFFARSFASVLWGKRRSDRWSHLNNVFDKSSFAHFYFWKGGFTSLFSFMGFGLCCCSCTAEWQAGVFLHV